MDDTYSLGYFQAKLKEFGIMDMLRERGLKNGDSIRIKDITFEYIE